MNAVLDLIGRVERRSRVLRAVERQVQPYRVIGNMAVAAGFDGAGRLPFEVPRADDVTHTEAGPPSSLPRARADVVLLGRAHRRVHARAFYVDAGLTLAVHDRIPLLSPIRLHRGAQVLERVYDRSSLLFPRPLERGRRLRHAWMVEDLIAGRQVDPIEWPGIIERELDGLWQMWSASGLRLASSAEWVVARHVAKGIAAARAEGMAERLPDAGRGLAKRFVVGNCHGDLQPHNMLRTRDGRLALIDWESADAAPIARDVVRALGWLPDPLPAAEEIGGRLESDVGVARSDWRLELVTECLALIGRLGARGRIAAERGRDDAPGLAVQRQRRYVDLLAQLASSSGS